MYIRVHHPQTRTDGPVPVVKGPATVSIQEKAAATLSPAALTQMYESILTLLSQTLVTHRYATYPGRTIPFVRPP